MERENRNFRAEKYKSKKVLETHLMDSIVQCGAEHTSKETMTENFQNLAKDINLHIQEAQQVIYKTNPKKSMLRHINIKLLRLFVVNLKAE